jgi:hypothetical protein
MVEAADGLQLTKHTKIPSISSPAFARGSKSPGFTRFTSEGQSKSKGVVSFHFKGRGPKLKEFTASENSSAMHFSISDLLTQIYLDTAFKVPICDLWENGKIYDIDSCRDYISVV